MPLGFAGGLHDRDTGLVKFGFRDYDPEVGRWTAKDPIGFKGGSTDLYGYSSNDPINLVDPTGLQSDSACENPDLTITEEEFAEVMSIAFPPDSDDRETLEEAIKMNKEMEWWRLDKSVWSKFALSRTLQNTRKNYLLNTNMAGLPPNDRQERIAIWISSLGTTGLETMTRAPDSIVNKETQALTYFIERWTTEVGQR